MKYIVTESQVKSLQDRIQELIDSTLYTLRQESDEWGMGEMDELHELNSVDKIVVDRVVKVSKIKVYINIYIISKLYQNFFNHNEK